MPKYQHQTPEQVALAKKYYDESEKVNFIEALNAHFPYRWSPYETRAEIEQQEKGSRLYRQLNVTPEQKEAYLYFRNIKWALEELGFNMLDPSAPETIKDTVDKDLSGILKDCSEPAVYPDASEADEDKAKKILRAYMVDFHPTVIRLPEERAADPEPEAAAAAKRDDVIIAAEEDKEKKKPAPPPSKTDQFTETWKKRLDERHLLPTGYKLDFKGNADTSKGFSIKCEAPSPKAKGKDELITFDAKGGATLNQKICEANGISQKDQIDLLVASFLARNPPDSSKKITISSSNPQLCRALQVALSGAGYGKVEVKQPDPPVQAPPKEEKEAKSSMPDLSDLAGMGMGNRK